MHLRALDDPSAVGAHDAQRWPDSVFAADPWGIQKDGLTTCPLPVVLLLQDGRNWARIEADHHTHALFDVGAAGEWDSTFIGHPQVRFFMKHPGVLCWAGLGFVLM